CRVAGGHDVLRLAADRRRVGGLHDPGADLRRLRPAAHRFRPRLGSSQVSHAVITGTASGIGLSLARRFLAEGWQVTGLDRNAEAFAAAGYSHVTLDVTDEPAMEAAFAAAAARAPISAVIANAAITDLAHKTVAE